MIISGRGYFIEFRPTQELLDLMDTSEGPLRIVIHNKHMDIHISGAFVKRHNQWYWQDYSDISPWKVELHEYPPE